MSSGYVKKLIILNNNEIVLKELKNLKFSETYNLLNFLHSTVYLSNYLRNKKIEKTKGITNICQSLMFKVIDDQWFIKLTAEINQSLMTIETVDDFKKKKYEFIITNGLVQIVKNIVHVINLEK
jgi:hypothetical protein